MQVGIFAKTFPGTEPLSVLNAVRSAGYDCAQFNLACCGLPAMPDAIADETIMAIEEAVSTSGVKLAALSGTYNMIHPDTTVRKEGLRRLQVVLEAAHTLNIPLVTLCTGTRDADDQWRHHRDNATPEAWLDLIREMDRAVNMADLLGVDLGIEPEQANVVTSANDAKKLIESIGSKRIRIVLDPANLFEVADRLQARRIVAEAIDSLGPAIAMAHAKDRHADGSFATAGTGVVDFADFVARLNAAEFKGAIVTHGLSADEAPGVAAYLHGLAGQ